MKIFFGPSSEFFAPNTPPSFWVEILNVVCPLLFPIIPIELKRSEYLILIGLIINLAQFKYRKNPN